MSENKNEIILKNISAGRELTPKEEELRKKFNLTHWDSKNYFAEYDTPEYNTKLRTKHLDKLSNQEQTLLERCLNKTLINPKYKMKYFQGADQLTPFHKLRQWLIELKTLEQAIEEWETKNEKRKLELELAEMKFEAAADPIQKKELEIQLCELRAWNNGLKQTAAQHYVERHHYIDLINEFLESDEGKTEDGRSLLEVFDTPEEDVYERHYWTIRLAKQAAMDLLMYGRIGSGNMSAIVTLDEAQQNEIISIAHRYNLEMTVHQEKIKNAHAKELGIDPGAATAISVDTSKAFVTNEEGKVKQSENSQPKDRNNMEQRMEEVKKAQESDAKKQGVKLQDVYNQ